MADRLTIFGGGVGGVEIHVGVGINRGGNPVGVLGTVVYSSKLFNGGVWTCPTRLGECGGIVDVEVQVGEAVIEGRGRKPDIVSFRGLFSLGFISRERWLVLIGVARMVEFFRRKKIVGAGDPYPT